MLKSVSDWQTLVTKLGLPDHIFEEIQINANSCLWNCSAEQRQRMITKWLDCDLNASWSKLADAMGIKKVAKDIRDKYVHGYRSTFTGGIRDIHLPCVIHSTVLIATVQVLIEVNK